MKHFITNLCILLLAVYSAAAQSTAGLQSAKVTYTQNDGTSSLPKPFVKNQIIVDTSISTITQFTLQYSLKKGDALTANTSKGTASTATSVKFDMGKDVLNTLIKLTEKDGKGKTLGTYNFTFVKAAPTTQSPLTQIKIQYYKKDGTPSDAVAIVQNQVTLDTATTTITKFSVQYKPAAGNTLSANGAKGQDNGKGNVIFTMSANIIGKLVTLTENNSADKPVNTYAFTFITTKPQAAPTGLQAAQVAYYQNATTLSNPAKFQNNQVQVDSKVTSITKFVLTYTPAAGDVVNANTTASSPGPSSGTLLFDFKSEMINASIKMVEIDAQGKVVDTYSFKFVNSKTPTATTSLAQADYDGYFAKNYSDLKLTDVGYKKKNTYEIHVFFDQFGNPLFSSIPTGIARKYHYIIHIIGDPADGTSRFVILQTSGSLTDNMNSYNSNSTAPSNSNLQGKHLSDDVSNIGETQFDLLPTDDDLGFTINTTDGRTTTPLKTYTIKKTSFYIGSFAVGIFKTWISSPTFSSVNSPTELGKQALKATNTTPYITATFMYTFYFSPYNALFPDNDGKHFSVWGRSYLDDDGVFLRKIYPALGIGLSGNVLSNWFVGLNCEPMQGFGIFAGRNIRNVNVFDAPSSVDLNNLTTDQFNYYQNTKTKSDWAVGIILDVSVFTKLASAITSSK